MSKRPSRSRSNSLQSMEKAVVSGVENEKEEHMLKTMTMLPADAIRWMNKRRPLDQTITKPSHIPPHQASQLREMFDGLDFDGGGEIDLKEFKDAIAYVSKHSCVGTSDILGDPKNVTAIFRAMDADGSGTVDFDEFLIAMTADTSAATGSNQLTKLRSTFYDFANVHRRQNMLEVIKDKNVSDSTKYQEFERLFKVEYFGDEEINLSVEEELAKSTKEVMAEKRKIGRLFKEKRYAEITRSRIADSVSKAERKRLLKFNKPGRKFEIPDVNRASHHYNRRKEFSKKMEDFSIHKETYLPQLKDRSQVRQYQENTLKTLRKSRSIDKTLLIEPAVSVREEWDQKAKTYALTGEF